MSEQLIHGGDLFTASERYGIPVEQWLDLSTGINPESYPLHDLAPEAFKQLPYLQPEFLHVAAEYYGSDQFLAVNGSQPVIQALPQVLEPLSVLLPEVGYDEHRYHWARNGNPLSFYSAFDLKVATEQIESRLALGEPFHLVVINPNNPSGLTFLPQTLIYWAERMPEGGAVIIDEAFVDTTPEQSVLRQALPDNMVVLRSFGKFFGLAGLRLGFAFANEPLRIRLQKCLGLWQVNGVAQVVAREALMDVAWQRGARSDIKMNSQFTQRLLAPLVELLQPQYQYQHGLFTVWKVTQSQSRLLQKTFAEQAVLIRVIPLDQGEALVRVGIIRRFDYAAVPILERAVACCIEALNRGDADV